MASTNIQPEVSEVYVGTLCGLVVVDLRWVYSEGQSAVETIPDNLFGAVLSHRCHPPKDERDGGFLHVPSNECGRRPTMRPPPFLLIACLSIAPWSATAQRASITQPEFAVTPKKQLNFGRVRVGRRAG